MGSGLFIIFILATYSTSLVHSFLSPFDKSMSLPYGRQLRAALSGRIPPMEDVLQDDLTWWQSIDRNNTINCKCGQFSVTTNQVERWENEGITSLNVYPWSVSLVSPGGIYAYCGGSLVNDRYVLTAASCVDGAKGGEVEVLIGSWPKAHFLTNMSDIDELNINSLLRKKVHRVIIHPKFTSNVLDYNVALLRLQGPVPTYGNSDGISHVCLPESDISYNGLPSSSLLWRFYNDDGFIIPEKRSEVLSQILSKEDCKNYKYNMEWEKMPDSLICSRMEIPIKETPYQEAYDCPGDAGGPLLITQVDKKVQVGIDSWTACYGRPKGVGVYTRIQEFLPWIKLHISLDGRTCAY